MRTFVAFLIGAVVLAAPVFSTKALAVAGVTTANVNFRSGPGTNFATMGVLQAGTAVEIGDCDESGAWCSVTEGGRDGFIAGRYLQTTEEQPAWPRVFTTDDGATLILYQPQVTEWDNFTDLKALVATEYKPNADASAVFGVIGITGKTQADRENNEVVINDIKVTELNFSALSREQLSAMSLEVGKILPTDPITISLQRLTASLAAYEQLGDVEGLKADPPPIFVSKTPAVLVQTEGEAVTAPIEAVDGLSFVVNTNWDLFQVAPDNTWYLRDETSWLSASALTGPWQEATSLPDVLSKLPDDDTWKDAREAIPPTAFEGGKVPAVIYSDKPAELILIDGEPNLEAVPNTALERVSNTETDLFFDTTTSTWYVLFSGRWFSAASLDGPWTFATTSLPDDFRRIPDDTPYYTVRSSIPGTSESDEARLKAMIPQMAKVDTDGTVTASVEYNGDPEFKPIEGTELSYASNTQSSVIQVGDKYYALQEGIWFVGDSPTGPWVVATSVPEPVYEIPPSSPVYNVTYVRIYETAPGYIWFGYTLGYLGAYLAWDNLVYGTGWYYRPYWGWYGPRRFPIYYPRPITYGFGAYYNPVRGIYGRYGYAYGPYRGLGRASWYNSNTGRYVRAGVSYGPAGRRGFVAAYNPRTGSGGFIAGGRGVYGSWGARGVTSVTPGAKWARGRASVNAGALSNRWRNVGGAAGLSAGRRPGDNVFAGRNGQVYRHQNGQWQQRVGNNWGAVQQRPQVQQRLNQQQRSNIQQRLNQQQRAAAGQNVNRRRPNQPQRPNFQSGNRSAVHPTVRVPQTRNAPSHLRSDQFGRQLGNQRMMQQRSMSRPSSPQFRSGNPGRGGGGISRSAPRGGGGFGHGGGGRRR